MSIGIVLFTRLKPILLFIEAYYVKKTKDWQTNDQEDYVQLSVEHNICHTLFVQKSSCINHLFFQP